MQPTQLTELVEKWKEQERKLNASRLDDGITIFEVQFLDIIASCIGSCADELEAAIKANEQ